MNHGWHRWTRMVRVRRGLRLAHLEASRAVERAVKWVERELWELDDASLASGTARAAAYVYAAFVVMAGGLLLLLLVIFGAKDWDSPVDYDGEDWAKFEGVGSEKRNSAGGENAGGNEPRRHKGAKELQEGGGL